MELVWNINSKENIYWCGKSLFDFISEKYRDLFLKIENSPRCYQLYNNEIIMKNPLIINENLFLINFIMSIYF